MSNNLDLDQVAANQSQKEVTINDQSAQLDAAVTEEFEVDVTAGNVTITADQYRDAVYYDITNATVAGREVTLQAIKRFIVISSSEDATESVDVILGTTTITIAATEKRIIYTDGTANGLFEVGGGSGGGGSTTFLALTDTPANFTGSSLKGLRVNVGETAVEFGDASAPYDVGSAFGGVPGSNEVVMQFVTTRAVTFASTLAPSEGILGIAATAQTDFDVQKNGVSFGTMRFAASGTVATFISASGSTFAAGDLLEVIAPGSADATAADLVFTLSGTR